MSSPWLQNLLGVPEENDKGRFVISPATVKNNLDLIAEGRVQVHVTARPAFEPWARLPAIGGAGGRGFLWVPQIGDEVLVAFADDDLSSAFVLGGLWSTENRPPLSLPTDFLTKKILRTGATDALGHELEFDDLKQSITITTSTEQQITLDPTKIQLSNTAGTLTITLDNESQEISIEALNKISLKAISIELNAAEIDLVGQESVSISSVSEVSVTAGLIKLN